MKLKIDFGNLTFLVLTFLFLPANLISAESLENDDDPWTFSFYFENDLFANTDGNYTNGTKFSWISPDLSEYREVGKLPAAVNRAIQFLPYIHKEGMQRNITLSFGQNIYTPDDIQRTTLDPNDRPYAGWLYFGIGYQTKSDRWLNIIEVNFGIVGPWALGEEAQNFVHETRDIPTAKGWVNQLKNEPALNIVWERRYRSVFFGQDGGLGLDGFIHYGASLGNVFTYANAGLGLRFGWNLPADFGASTIRLAGDTNAPSSREDLRNRKDKLVSFHLFFGVDGRGVLRDLTLDGNTFRDSHSVDREPWVADFIGGLAFVVGDWKISYSQVRRTKTFEGSRDHSFGSINISFSY